MGFSFKGSNITRIGYNCGFIHQHSRAQHSQMFESIIKKKQNKYHIVTRAKYGNNFVQVSAIAFSIFSFFFVRVVYAGLLTSLKILFV